MFQGFWSQFLSVYSELQNYNYNYYNDNEDHNDDAELEGLVEWNLSASDVCNVMGNGYHNVKQ